MSQHTLARPVELEGVGLHSGVRARVHLRPASPGTGIVFQRDDLPGAGALPAHVRHVVDTRMATSIGNGAWRVATVEHLLAALVAAGIDNVVVGIDAEEVPALDGSAQPWLERIESAGLRGQAAARKVLVVRSPVEVTQDGRTARLLPSPVLELSARILFDHPLVGEQRHQVSLVDGEFARQLAWARTFGFLGELQAMVRMGLAMGGSLANAVVYDPDAGVLNREGLRHPHEPVRHKMLDMLGDLALAGWPVRARFEADLPGHCLNVALVGELLSRPDCWVLEELA